MAPKKGTQAEEKNQLVLQHKLKAQDKEQADGSEQVSARNQLKSMLGILSYRADASKCKNQGLGTASPRSLAGPIAVC